MKFDVRTNLFEKMWIRHTHVKKVFRTPPRERSASKSVIFGIIISDRFSNHYFHVKKLK